MPRKKTEYYKYITDGEVEALEEFALEYSPSVRLAFYIMLHTGLRCSEAIKIKVDDIDLDNGVMLVHATKQDKVIERAIPNKLILRLSIHIKQHKKTIEKCEGYVCFAYGHGAKQPHISYKTMAWFFAHFRKKMKSTPYHIKKDGKPQYRIATHSLRSRFITKFIQEASKELGANSIKLAQQVIGHRDPETTMRYVRIPDALNKSKDIINRL